MEVKDGYKKTEIGVIPVDWDVVSVDKNFDFYQNNTYSRDCMNEKGVDIQNIHYGDILIKYGSILDCDKENIPFLNMGISVSLSNRTVQSGDIIIADTAEDNTVGKAIEVINTKSRKVVSGLHTIFIRPHAGLFAERYLGYFFNAPIYHNQLLPYIVGIKVSSISKKTIRNTMILRPCLEEQQAIAAALSDVDNLISSLNKLINKKKNIKQGAMQELLTGKKRLDGFSGDWDEIKLGMISKINTGKKNNDDKVPDGIYPFFVRSKQIERIDTYSFDGEAIIIPGEGNIGEIFHYINGKFDYHQRVYKISNFPTNIYAKYVFYYIAAFFGEYALKNTVKATVDSLRLPTFEEFIINVPKTIQEQTAIASILSDMDAEIEALEQKLNKYKAIKQGMMQELLTGRIRLI